MKDYHDIRRMKRPPTHPGEILLEELLARGLSQAGAARRMRISASRLNALIRKKRRVKQKGWKCGSPATLLGLSREEADRLDIEVARQRLADPSEVPIPYER